MKIGNKDLNERCFIIAELSANHNGSLELAKKTIQAAKEVGADAVKLQTYTADTMTMNVRNKDFKISSGTVWDGKYLYDLYKEAYTPWEWHSELIELSNSLGMECFSSPFDSSAVDFLENLDVPAYKIASFEITDIPLIKYVARKKKPVIISTGIASKNDIDLAVETIRSEGNNQIVILKCTSSYPAPLEEANLSMIKKFKNDYNVEAGLSDHTLGIIAPVVAVSLGARVIEKHFILDRGLGGPDSSFSLNKEEFKEMVDAVRKAESSIGVPNYSVTDKSKNGRVFSRSLYFDKNLEQGDTVDDLSIRSVRPGHGLHPKHYDEIIGKKLVKKVQKGQRVTWDFFKKD